MSIDWCVSIPQGDTRTSAIYLPTSGVTSLAGYAASADVLASNAAGSRPHRSRGHHAARHHAAAGQHHRRTRSRVQAHVEKPDGGLEQQTF